MPPLTSHDLTFGFALGGATRGIVVGLAVAIGMIPFAPVEIHHPGFVIFHGIAAGLMLALLGMIGGIWAEKFDHIAAATNFVITPLAFLSGTFYSIERLPAAAQTAAHFNPLFYAIDGFRYGFIDRADSNVWLGVGVMVATNTALWFVCYLMFRSGYKLKA
jgi:ABC-2 type transport system permease protein